jgi:hypothetical protein
VRALHAGWTRRRQGRKMGGAVPHTDELDARLGFCEDTLVLGVASWTGTVSTSISKGGVSSLQSGSTTSFLTGGAALGPG